MFQEGIDFALANFTEWYRVTKILNTEDTKAAEGFEATGAVQQILAIKTRKPYERKNQSLSALRVLRVQSFRSRCNSFLALIAPSGVSSCFRKA